MERTLTLRMDAELMDAIDAEAKRQKRSRATVVREALQKGLEQRKTVALDLMKNLVGAVQGPHDLSTNKKYLKNMGTKRRADHP